MLFGCNCMDHKFVIISSPVRIQRIDVARPVLIAQAFSIHFEKRAWYTAASLSEKQQKTTSISFSPCLCASV